MVGAAGSRRARCRSPSMRDRDAGGLLVLPHVLERAEAKFLLVVEARVVDAAHVLLTVLVGEGVVRVRRFPAVDHEVPTGLLDVAQKLGSDEACGRVEELRPFAASSVCALERFGVANLVAEDQRYHGAIMGAPR